jgi:hypothetical protein
MNSTFSRPRRQLLTTAAGTLLAPQLVGAKLLTADKPQIIRQAACWQEDSNSLHCWMDGFQEDLPQAVDDLQSVWGERAVVHHLNFQDFELLLKPHKTLGLPLVRAACATSHSWNDAAEIAFTRAGVHRLRNTGKTFYAGILVLSAPDSSRFLESLLSMRSWTQRNIPDDAFFGMQFLVDRTLARGSKRVSVVIAP